MLKRESCFHKLNMIKFDYHPSIAIGLSCNDFFFLQKAMLDAK